MCELFMQIKTTLMLLTVWDRRLTCTERKKCVRAHIGTIIGITTTKYRIKTMRRKESSRQSENIMIIYLLINTIMWMCYCSFANDYEHKLCVSFLYFLRRPQPVLMINIIYYWRCWKTGFAGWSRTFVLILWGNWQERKPQCTDNQE